MGLGKRDAQTLCSENRDLGGLYHPAVSTQAAQAVGEKWTLTQCNLPCACTDKMLAPAIYLQELLLISFCPQLCQYVGAVSVPLVPALCTGMAVRKQHLGCPLRLVKSPHTHRVQGKDVSHRVNSEPKASSNHLILLPFYKMQIKKIMKQ